MLSSMQNAEEGDRVWNISQIICLRASWEARGPQNTRREMLPVSKIIHRKRPRSPALPPPHLAPSPTTLSSHLPSSAAQASTQKCFSDFFKQIGPFHDSGPLSMLLLCLEFHLLLSHLAKSSWLVFSDMARDYFPWTSFSSNPHLIHLNVPNISHGTQNV